MRLAEAAGLAKDDIHLDEDTPFVNIRPHPWRRLKTLGSQRKIPLVGSSLWAAKQACKASNTRFLFPRYCDGLRCKSNSASAALNKWLKQIAGSDYVIHSFRHAMRDRLRAIGCQSEMIDQIGGWSSGKVGEAYGSGFNLEKISKKLGQIVIP
jgi:integrase